MACSSFVLPYDIEIWPMLSESSPSTLLPGPGWGWKMNEVPPTETQKQILLSLTQT